VSVPRSPKPLVSTLISEDPELADIVREFVDGLDVRLAEFRAAHEAMDWAALAKLAHRLKGAGGSYGYPDLTDLGKRMEDAFNNRTAADFAGWMQKLADLSAAAKAGLG
jgi:HPt (histidine-containing phosphotransfer) domain-containing protein